MVKLIHNTMFCMSDIFKGNIVGADGKEPELFKVDHNASMLPFIHMKHHNMSDGD